MNFEEARNNMVLNQLRANRISNASLIEKIELFPRESLFPNNFKHLSYSDSIIHLNDGRFVLPPLTSFHLVQALNPSYHNNILEIGSGFGTTTSILNQFTNNIDCIESSEEMINTFNDSMKSGLFSAKLLKNNIELFFTNKNPNIKKYQKTEYLNDNWFLSGLSRFKELNMKKEISLFHLNDKNISSNLLNLSKEIYTSA